MRRDDRNIGNLVCSHHLFYITFLEPVVAVVMNSRLHYSMSRIGLPPAYTGIDVGQLECKHQWIEKGVQEMGSFAREQLAI